jgi:hypothetical protein
MFFVLITNPLSTVIVSIVATERWFFVSVVLNGIIKSV